MKKLILSTLLVFSSIVTSMASGHVATAVVMNPICYGTCSGNATGLASGGVGPYGYTWAGPGGGPTFFVGQYANALCAGSYVLTVIDSSDMSTATYAFNIVDPFPLTITLPPTYTTCLGSCVTLTPSVSGGSLPYMYDWYPGSFLSSSTAPNPIACVATSMTYTLVVTDGNGCTNTALTTVIVDAGPSTTLTPTSSTCSACNGSISTSSAGAVAYSWAGPSGYTSTIASPTGLCAGTYTLNASSSMGCVSSTLATVSASSPITATISPSPTGCSACTGSALVAASGGSGPYSYNWSPGSPIGDGTTGISSLCVGSYSVMVTDTNGCSFLATTTIGTTTPIVVTSIPTASDCGACNGTVTTLESGGTAPYLYDLTGYPQQSNGNFSGICAGSYVATVTDINGCVGMYTVLVSSNNTTSFSVANSIQNETGFGLANGSIDLTISGSAPPYTFLWNNGATTEDIYSLSPGTYSVIITDNNGDCGTYSFTVSSTVTYGYITGYVYNDNNLNCIFDSGDSPLYGYFIYATDGTNTYYGYTNSAGYYSILTPIGSYNVNSVTSAYLEVACTNTYSLNVAAGTTLTNNNFSYTLPPVYDVCVNAYTSGVIPGFNGNYSVTLFNSGNQAATGVVYFVLPAVLTYITATPTPTSISGDTLFWNYTLLPAYSNQYYYVSFNTPASTPLGIITTAYVNATLTNGTDINPACNSYVYNRVTSGSYDPNAKTVSPAGEGVTGNIDLTEQEFTYLIQFQNTGSGPAVNINITDTISSMLDLMSFQMLESSDSCVIELLPGNVIRWKFDNIMLPDSTSDEVGSHGHILFKIVKATSPVLGEVIENTASIYFDFNAPVITNTAINTYASLMGFNEQISASGNINVYPNPFSESTTFVINSEKANEIYSFELTDVLGKKVKSLSGISAKQFEISRDGLENGIYFYKIYSSESIIGVGKVVIK